MTDVNLTPCGERDGFEYRTCKCDSCGDYTMCVEHWHRGAPVLTMCEECSLPMYAEMPWTTALDIRTDFACARVMDRINSNAVHACVNLMRASDEAAERYR
jgi:hypothetical protein